MDTLEFEIVPFASEAAIDGDQIAWAFERKDGSQPTPTCTSDPLTLACFDAFKAQLKPFHRSQLDAIARTIANSQRRSRVRIVGHAVRWSGKCREDLALERARLVERELRSRLNALGIGGRVVSVAETAGCFQSRVNNDTQQGRALNRRVEVAIEWITDPKPDPDPDRPRPVDPDPPVLRRSPCQKAQPTGYRDIEPFRLRADHKARRALLRFKKLRALAEPQRAVAWNSGPERRWFGAYREGSRANFAFVAAMIERISAILIRKEALQIHCPATRQWIDVDRRSTNNSVGDPARFVVQPPPHALGLGSAWFGPHLRGAVPPWEHQRIGAFVEAAAHYAGANANISRTNAAGHLRLAVARPRLARVTAKNYALYVIDAPASALKDDRPCRQEHESEIKAAIEDARRACRAVRRRLNVLSQMTEQARAKAWNAGPEKIWFGSYERGSKTTGFAFVADLSEGICLHLLARTVSINCCYVNSVPSRGEISCDAEPCSGDATSFGFVENPGAPGDGTPIHLVNAWFCKPSSLSTADWHLIRATTLIHESAHIAGAKREVYLQGPARRLAARNARGARKNAQNYAYYFLAVANENSAR